MELIWVVIYKEWWYIRSKGLKFYEDTALRIRLEHTWRLNKITIDNIKNSKFTI